MNKRFSWSIVLILTVFLISGFTLSSVYKTTSPTVETGTVHIKEDSTTLQGIIHNTGGKEISQYGFKWGTSRDLGEKKSLSGNIKTDNPFSFTIKGLKEGNTYYYQAYAVNAKGTSGGDIKSFTVPVKYNAVPVVFINNPNNGLVVTRGEVVKITAIATDDNKIETMKLYINNQPMSSAKGESLTCDWDTGKVSPGEYAIKTIAWNGARTGENTITLTVKDEPQKVGESVNSAASAKAKTSTAAVTKTDKIAQAKPVSAPGSRGVTSADRSKYPRLSKVNGSFGQFYYRDTSGGRIEINPHWVAENIVTIKLPGLNRYVQVHKDAKDNFIQAFKYIENGTATINGKQVPLLSLIKTMDGTFVTRHVNWNPSRGLSNHSWGTAIDINAASHFRYVNPANEPNDPNYILWEKAFKPAGFSWGNSYSDSMHYEVIK